jgi:hypothetical protein
MNQITPTYLSHVMPHAISIIAHLIVLGWMGVHGGIMAHPPCHTHPLIPIATNNETPFGSGSQVHLRIWTGLQIYHASYMGSILLGLVH